MILIRIFEEKGVRTLRDLKLHRKVTVPENRIIRPYIPLQAGISGPVQGL
jgi:hypothetical protein